MTWSSFNMKKCVAKYLLRGIHLLILPCKVHPLCYWYDLLCYWYVEKIEWPQYSILIYSFFFYFFLTCAFWHVLLYINKISFRVMLQYTPLAVPFCVVTHSGLFRLCSDPKLLLLENNQYAPQLLMCVLPVNGHRFSLFSDLFPDIKVERV